MDEPVAAPVVDPDPDPRRAAEAVDAEAAVAADHVLGIAVRHRHVAAAHEPVVEDVRVGVDDGDMIDGLAALGEAEDAASVISIESVFVGIELGQPVEAEEPGEVAAGHERFVVVGELAVVDERAGGAGALERPLGPQEQPLGPELRGQELRAVVDLEAGELDEGIRVAAHQGEHVAGVLPTGFLEEDGQARMPLAEPVHLGERRLLIFAVAPDVDEERNPRHLQRREDGAADGLIEAVAVAAGEQLGGPHAPLLHLGDDVGAGRHLARVVRHEHPAREEPVVAGDLVEEHAVAVDGAVLAGRPVPHERAVDAGMAQVAQQRRRLPRHADVRRAVHADGAAGVEVAARSGMGHGL